MVLDCKIHNWPAGLCLLAALLGWNVYVLRRFDLVFRQKHRRDPRKGLLIMPREVLNEEYWTPEGIQEQRRYIKSTVVAAVLGLVLWLVLGWMF